MRRSQMNLPSQRQRASHKCLRSSDEELEICAKKFPVAVFKRISLLTRSRLRYWVNIIDDASDHSSNVYIGCYKKQSWSPTCEFAWQWWSPQHFYLSTIWAGVRKLTGFGLWPLYHSNVFSLPGAREMMTMKPKPMIAVSTFHIFTKMLTTTALKRKTSLESFFKDFSSWLTEPGYKWDIRAPTKSKRYILWENYQNTLSTNTRKGSGWTVDLKNGSFTLHLLVEWEWDDILNGWDGSQPQWRTFSQGPPTRFLVCLYWTRMFNILDKKLLLFRIFNEDILNQYRLYRGLLKFQ